MAPRLKNSKFKIQLPSKNLHSLASPLNFEI
jgi:hypothetical protein